MTLVLLFNQPASLPARNINALGTFALVGSASLTVPIQIAASSSFALAGGAQITVVDRASGVGSLALLGAAASTVAIAISATTVLSPASSGSATLPIAIAAASALQPVSAASATAPIQITGAGTFQLLGGDVATGAIVPAPIVTPILYDADGVPAARVSRRSRNRRQASSRGTFVLRSESHAQLLPIVLPTEPEETDLDDVFAMLLAAA